MEAEMDQMRNQLNHNFNYSRIPSILKTPRKRHRTYSTSDSIHQRNSYENFGLSQIPKATHFSINSINPIVDNIRPFNACFPSIPSEIYRTNKENARKDGKFHGNERNQMGKEVSSSMNEIIDSSLRCSSNDQFYEANENIFSGKNGRNNGFDGSIDLPLTSSSSFAHSISITDDFPSSSFNPLNDVMNSVKKNINLTTDLLDPIIESNQSTVTSIDEIIKQNQWKSAIINSGNTMNVENQMNNIFNNTNNVNIEDAN
jgi:hypothetical protein